MQEYLPGFVPHQSTHEALEQPPEQAGPGDPEDSTSSQGHLSLLAAPPRHWHSLLLPTNTGKTGKIATLKPPPDGLGVSTQAMCLRVTQAINKQPKSFTWIQALHN